MNTQPTAALRSRASAAVPPIAISAPITRASATAVPSTASVPTITQGINTMIKTVDFVAFGKDNLEAFTASSKIWTAGVQDITKQFAATAKTSFEESVATFKALSTVKSVKEAIDLQSAYGKTVATKMQEEATRLTDASRKLTEQALAPITARVAVAVGSFSKAA